MRTYGYDYSYAITIDEVNKILAANLASVNMKISYSSVDPDTGTTITVQGQLAPWQLNPKGDNNLLSLNVPFAQGTMSFTGGFLSGKYDLSGVTAVMKISLSWMGSGTAQSAQGSGDMTNLVFAPVSTTDPDNPGYVATDNILDPQKKLDTTASGILAKIMADLIIENKDNLKVVFNSINPAPANVATWLKPFKWQYFYQQTSAGNVFCFLCQLTDKNFPAQPAFDSTALQRSTNTTILISQEVFFANAILPAIRNALRSNNFNQITLNEACVVTNNGDFIISTPKGAVTANSFKLTASSSGNGLACYTAGGGPLKFLFGLDDLPDATYSWSFNTINPLSFTNNTISFQNDPNPTVQQSSTMYWYDWVLLVVTGITSAEGLASAIVDSVNGFSNQIQAVGMSNVNSTIEASLTGSVVNLANLVDWKQSNQTFQAVNAGLNGAMYAYGNLS
ncbi:TULIP family P47-like protein [Dyadobacter sp. NIV53]|uniref:TULIP family P47-like protein n=1 Tax=Dyadobacter sp. NIV53 TaxID=2861765 RepID=UPI001C86BE1F|nr:TULIP family P47-like protein [Dyadobacter sp. NIV53]